MLCWTCTTVLQKFVCNISYNIVSVTFYVVLYLHSSLQCSVCITVCMTVSVAHFTFLCLHHKLKYNTSNTVYSPVVFLSCWKELCLAVQGKTYIAHNFSLLINLSSASQKFPHPYFHSERGKSSSSFSILFPFWTRKI